MTSIFWDDVDLKVSKPNMSDKQYKKFLEFQQDKQLSHKFLIITGTPIKRETSFYNMVNLSLSQRNLVAKMQAAKEHRTQEKNFKKQKAQQEKEVKDEKKYLVKHNKRAENSLINRFIRPELSKLAKQTIKQNGATFETSINRLDKMENPRQTNSQICEESFEENDHDYFVKKVPPRQRNPDLWAEVIKRDIEELKQEEKMQRIKKLQQNEETRAFLDNQVKVNVKVKESEKNENMIYTSIQNKKLEEWKAKEKNIQKQKEEANMAERVEFKKLLQETREKKEREKERRIRAELREVERAKALVAEDKRLLEEEKQRRNEQQKLILLENKRMQEIKCKEVEKIRQHELQINKEYKEKLDRLEAQRAAELEATYALQERRVNVALFNVKSDAEIAKEDEEKARVIQEKAKKEEDEKWRIRQEQRKAANLAQARELKQQQDERQRELVQKKIEFNDQAIVWAQEVKDAEIKHRQDQKARLEKNMQHRKRLEEQIRGEHYRRENTNRYGMSDIEMTLNRHLLENAGITKGDTSTLICLGGTSIGRIQEKK